MSNLYISIRKHTDVPFTRAIKRSVAGTSFKSMRDPISRVIVHGRTRNSLYLGFPFVSLITIRNEGCFGMDGKNYFYFTCLYMGHVFNNIVSGILSLSVCYLCHVSRCYDGGSVDRSLLWALALSPNYCWFLLITSQHQWPRMSQIDILPFSMITNLAPIQVWQYIRRIKNHISQSLR